MILPAIFWGYWLAYRSVRLLVLLTVIQPLAGITGTGQ